MANKPLCVIQSPIFTRSGYGDLSLDVVKSTVRYDKFDVLLVPTKWGACSKRTIENDVGSENKSLLNKIIRSPLNRQPDVFIQISIPNEFQPMGKYNIGITAGIETTVARPEWVEGLNRMNVNFATSVHSKKIFESATYTKNYQDGRPQDQITSKKPLEVLFWGANTSLYYKTDEKVDSIEEALSVIKEDFAFLFVGQWTSGNMIADRKGIGFLIKTFLEAFRHSKNKPCLLLKTSGAAICNIDKHECLNKINEVRKMVESDGGGGVLPNVYLLHGELNDTEMNALFNHDKVKAHVSFTHGEGYGHPLLLATLSGKPIFAPNWSGHLDFLNPDYANLLDGDIVQLPPEAVNEHLIKESGWFNVDYKKAATRLSNFYHNDNRNFLRKAESLRLENAEKFSIQSMDKLYHSLLDKYVPAFSTQQQFILPKLKKISK